MPTDDRQTDHAPQDSTPNDRLRELVEEWRGDIPEDPYRMAIYTKRNSKRLQCARELEELIEDD